MLTTPPWTERAVPLFAPATQPNARNPRVRRGVPTFRRMKTAQKWGLPTLSQGAAIRKSSHAYYAAVDRAGCPTFRPGHSAQCPQSAGPPWRPHFSPHENCAKVGTAYSVPRRRNPRVVTCLLRRRGQSGLSPLFRPGHSAQCPQSAGPSPRPHFSPHENCAKVGTAYSVPRRRNPRVVTYLLRRRGQSGLSPLFRPGHSAQCPMSSRVFCTSVPNPQSAGPPWRPHFSTEPRPQGAIASPTSPLNRC